MTTVGQREIQTQQFLTSRIRLVKPKPAGTSPAVEVGL